MEEYGGVDVRRIVFLTRWHFCASRKICIALGSTAISGRRAEQYADLAVGYWYGKSRRVMQRTFSSQSRQM